MVNPVRFDRMLAAALALGVFLLSACAQYTPGEMGGQDSAETQYAQGVSYLLGQGVPQNDAAALRSFRRAAASGNAYAEAQLGFMYAAGRGVKRDYAAAFHWYTLAADHGLASAQYNLGLMYAHGVGAPKDPQRARALFNDAAEHGFEPARKALRS